VKGETLDGDDVLVAITGSGPSQWADAISALSDCWTLTALDKDGNTLRVLELDPKDPEFANELADRDDFTPSRSSTTIAVDVPKLVDNIARNMREVSASAATQQANAFREGFAAMTSVVNLCLQMLVRVEQRLQQAEDRSIDHHGPDDGRQQLAMMALQRALGGSAPTQPAAPSNGGGIQITPAMIGSLLEQFMTHGASEGDGSNGSG
jgi:hypothetical protein